MKTIQKILVCGILLGLIAASCAVLNPAGTNELDDTNWQLLYIRKSAPIAGRPITIAFKDGQVNGSSGCNSYFGEYSVKANEISFGPLASTEMACMDPEGIMDQEYEYLTFLSEVVTYSIEGDQLILKKKGQDQLTFQKSMNE